MKTRLLIIKPSSLGDIVQSLQVAAALKTHQPDIEITWVVRDLFADVVRYSGVVDHIILFHRREGLLGFYNCLRAIRAAGKFDTVWDFQGLLRSGIMTFFAKSKAKYGREDAREGSSFFYNHKVKLPSKHPHAVEILAAFLPTYSIPAKIEKVPFQFPASALEKFSVLQQVPYVMLFPESRGPKKEWQHFDELTAYLCQRYPEIFFVWAGTLQKKHPHSSAFPNFIDIQGLTTLAEVLTLVQNCAGVVGNDSGCMHFGAACQKPVLAIFKTTDPKRYGPYPTESERHTIVNNPKIPFPELKKFEENFLKNISGE